MKVVADGMFTQLSVVDHHPELGGSADRNVSLSDLVLWLLKNSSAGSHGTPLRVRRPSSQHYLLGETVVDMETSIQVRTRVDRSIVVATL